MVMAGTQGDALRIEIASVESRSLAAVGTIPGVAVLAAAGRNGPGVGRLRAMQDGTYLHWRAPGSATFGPATHCEADADVLIRDGEDTDKWVRARVALDYLVAGPVDGSVHLGDRFGNAVGHDNVTAAEALAGNVEAYTVDLANVSTLILSSVVAWLDAAVSGLEISDDGITYVSPTSEATGLSLADIPAGGSITFYLRRTVAATAASDPEVLNHICLAFDGL